MSDSTHKDSNERWLARLLGGDFLLWSPNIQAEGFLHWDRIFATRRVPRARGFDPTFGSFAHGFAVLSETADFFYKCDNLYSPKDEIVVRWDDPAIGIDWGVTEPSLSARDAAADNGDRPAAVHRVHIPNSVRPRWRMGGGRLPAAPVSPARSDRSTQR